MFGDRGELEIGAQPEIIAAHARLGFALLLFDDAVGRVDERGVVLGGGLRTAPRDLVHGVRFCKASTASAPRSIAPVR